MFVRVNTRIKSEYVDLCIGSTLNPNISIPAKERILFEGVGLAGLTLYSLYIVVFVFDLIFITKIITLNFLKENSGKLILSLLSFL